MAVLDNTSKPNMNTYKTASQRRPAKKNTAAFAAKKQRRNDRRAKGITPSKLETKARELEEARRAEARARNAAD